MEVKFTTRVIGDVDIIYEYLSRDDECVAKSVLMQIEKIIDYIKEFPELGKNGDLKNTREIIVPKLPFVIVYEVVNSVIYILTIFHTSLDPYKKYNK